MAQRYKVDNSALGSTFNGWRLDLLKSRCCMFKHQRLSYSPFRQAYGTIELTKKPVSSQNCAQMHPDFLMDGLTVALHPENETTQTSPSLG